MSYLQMKEKKHTQSEKAQKNNSFYQRTFMKNF